MDIERWELYALVLAVFGFGVLAGIPVGGAMWRHMTGPGFSGAVEADLRRLTDRARRLRGTA
jgi:hypothetical protein